MSTRISFLAIIFLLSIYNAAYAQYPNGNFEMGNFTNYHGYTGFNTTGKLDLTTFTPSFSGVSITHTSMFDPFIPGLATVKDGNFAAKVGRLGPRPNFSEADILSYTFTAASASQFISFQYAAVLEAGHPSVSDNSFFSYWVSSSNILNSSTLPSNLVFLKQINVADPSLSQISYEDPTHGTTPVYYNNWTKECVPLNNLIPGQQYTIYFAATGCDYGLLGHFGYVYIDDLNSGIPDFTFPDLICSNNGGVTVDASATGPYDDGTWSMFKLNSNNINDVVSGTTSTWSLASTGVVFNIGNAYFPWTTITSENKWNTGGNGYYGITLKVKDCMGDDISVSHIVNIELPTIQADNVFICCKDLPKTVILKAEVDEVTPHAGGVITWYDDASTNLGIGITTVSTPAGGGTVTASTLNQTITAKKKYKIVYTNTAGCENSKWITCLPMQYAGDDPTSITKWKLGIPGWISGCSSSGLCAGILITPADPLMVQCDGSEFTDSEDSILALSYPYTYSWSTGETTSTISTADHPGISSFTVNLTDVCGTTIPGTFNLPSPYMNGNFPTDLVYNPDIPIGTPHTLIYESGIPIGYPAAYNATSYRLQIFNRGGQEVYDLTGFPKTKCAGFNNGDIMWDGIGNVSPFVGVTLPADTYNFELNLYNCDPVLGINGQESKVFKGAFSAL